MNVKIIGFVLTIIISILPRLWIENYTLTNPIWWTVMTVWLIGRLLGWIEGWED